MCACACWYTFRSVCMCDCVCARGTSMCTYCTCMCVWRRCGVHSRVMKGSHASVSVNRFLKAIMVIKNIWCLGWTGWDPQMYRIIAVVPAPPLSLSRREHSFPLQTAHTHTHPDTHAHIFLLLSCSHARSTEKKIHLISQIRHSKQ